MVSAWTNIISYVAPCPPSIVSSINFFFVFPLFLAFITFDCDSAAQFAIAEMNGYYLHEDILEVALY